MKARPDAASSGSGQDGFGQLEMQGDEFEVGMQIVLRQAGDMDFLELACAGESLAAPDFFGDIAKADIFDLGRTDQAAQALLQKVRRLRRTISVNAIRRAAMR